MAVATLRIPSTTEQVRLVRLVAAAAARRSGVGEDVLDELRLAVGEAAARAVLRQQENPHAEVIVELDDSTTEFEVRVTDLVAAKSTAVADDEWALSLISALSPQSHVETSVGGSVVSMKWPIPG